MGTAPGMDPGNVIGAEPRGHLFAFRTDDMDRVLPDEDSVGLFAFEYTSQNVHTGHRWRQRRPSGLRFGPEIAAAVPDRDTQHVWEWLRSNVRDALWDDLSWIGGQKAFGKAAVKVMTEDVSRTFLSWGAHIAHTGRTLLPVGRWSLDLADCRDMAADGSDLFGFAHRVFGPDIPETATEEQTARCSPGFT